MPLSVSTPVPRTSSPAVLGAAFSGAVAGVQFMPDSSLQLNEGVPRSATYGNHLFNSRREIADLNIQIQKLRSCIVSLKSQVSSASQTGDKWQLRPAQSQLPPGNKSPGIDYYLSLDPRLLARLDLHGARHCAQTRRQPLSHEELTDRDEKGN